MHSRAKASISNASEAPSSHDLLCLELDRQLGPVA
jgi:hypothetical protein